MFVAGHVNMKVDDDEQQDEEDGWELEMLEQDPNPKVLEARSSRAGIPPDRLDGSPCTW